MHWLGRKDYNFYKGGTPALKFFFNKLQQRKKIDIGKSEHVLRLKKDGYCVIKNFFNLEKIKYLKKEFQECIEKDIVIATEEFSTIPNPLLNSKSAFEISCNEEILNIVAGYYSGRMPSLCTQNFRLSKLTDTPPVSTQLFHCDQNSIDFLKVFIYLNDVDLNGGPFTYVKGSHNKKPLNYLSKHRWTDKEVRDIYGKDSIVHVTANADFKLCNTPRIRYVQKI